MQDAVGGACETCVNVTVHQHVTKEASSITHMPMDISICLPINPCIYPCVYLHIYLIRSNVPASMVRRNLAGLSDMNSQVSARIESSAGPSIPQCIWPLLGNASGHCWVAGLGKSYVQLGGRMEMLRPDCNDKQESRLHSSASNVNFNISRQPVQMLGH